MPVFEAFPLDPCYTCGSRESCDCDNQDAPQDRDYCRHGNYVGNMFTGDFICGQCEEGEE